MAPAGGPGRAAGRLAWGWPGRRCPALASVAGRPDTSSYVFMRGGLSGACGWAGSRGRPVGLGLARPALPGVGECRWTASYELIRIHAWRFGCGWVAVVGGLGAWPAAVVRSADGPRRGDIARGRGPGRGWPTAVGVARAAGTVNLRRHSPEYGPQAGNYALAGIVWHNDGAPVGCGDPLCTSRPRPIRAVPPVPTRHGSPPAPEFAGRTPQPWLSRSS